MTNFFFQKKESEKDNVQKLTFCANCILEKQKVTVSDRHP